jgi:D-sedoheptulose 7-phosphate isomerase
MNKNYQIEGYLEETIEILKYLKDIRIDEIQQFTSGLHKLLLTSGRLFLFGVGGSAANCSHATNDFRKILGIRTYCATDNVAELTARINDQTWEDSLAEWLKAEQPEPTKDAIMVFSVGGGNEKVSQNLVRVMEYSNKLGMPIFSIVGRNGGIAKKLSDYCIHIPESTIMYNLQNRRITPHVEELQGVLFHMIVSLIKEKEDRV